MLCRGECIFFFFFLSFRVYGALNWAIKIPENPSKIGLRVIILHLPTYKNEFTNLNLNVSRSLHRTREAQAVANPLALRYLQHRYRLERCSTSFPHSHVSLSAHHLFLSSRLDYDTFNFNRMFTGLEVISCILVITLCRLDPATSCSWKASFFLF